MTDTTIDVVARHRERLAGVVQAVGRRPADIARRPWESGAVFAVFAVFYSVVGYIAVVRLHVLGFETLDRFDRALMIFWNSPPKLSAVGFDYPPLSILLVAPFVLVPALAKSLIVIPVASALFAGATMTVVNTMMRRAGVVPPLRVAALAGLGLNPLVVMYASLGDRQFLWLAFTMAALGALFAWYVTADIRFVMIAGLMYAIAALTGYGSLMWFAVSAVMVSAILARLGADGDEIEGTTVGFAAPTVYVITLWTGFNLILLFKPFNWLTASSDSARSGGLDHYSLAEIAIGVGKIVLYGAPIAIVVLPALIFVGIAKRNTFALWIGLLLALAILTPGLAVLLRVTDSPLLMSNALPILLLSVVGALWLVRSSVDNAMLVAGALVAGLLFSIPWTFHAMPTFKHQGIERAFHDAITTGQSQEGATAVDGSIVGYDNEKDMADWIQANIHADNAILTDNAQTYGVIYFTGDPGKFFDRVDQSDGPWRRAAEDPAAHVQYLLLSTDTSTDLLSKLYPAAAADDDSVLQAVHANDRYVLVKVPAGYHYGDEPVTRRTDSTSSTGTGDTGTTGSTGSGTDTQSCVTGGSVGQGGIGGVVGEGDTCQPLQPGDVDPGSDNAPTAPTSGTTPGAASSAPAGATP